MNEHIAGEVLAAYVDGTLPSGPRQQAEAHLSRCRECREALAEVFAIGIRRAPVPPEFLERALRAVPPRYDGAVSPRSDGEPGEAIVKPAGVPARKVLPLRLAFGVAAALLVALAVNYLFIGRERAGVTDIAQKRIVEPAVTARAAADAARAPAPAETPHGPEAEKKRVPGEAVPGPTAAAISVKSKIPAEAAGREERLQVADETDAMPLREGEGGVIGGVLGGVAAPPERDDLAVAKAAELTPGRDKGSRSRKAEMRLSRFSGSAAAGDAMQLFLAATGRAAAPRLVPAEAWSQAPPVRIAGDAAEEDLIAPRPLSAWDWLPAGAALEVTIAGNGSVRSIRLLGEWDAGAADRARTGAGKLLFAESTLETRRAVLSRDPLN